MHPVENLGRGSVMHLRREGKFFNLLLLRNEGTRNKIMIYGNLRREAMQEVQVPILSSFDRRFGSSERTHIP